MSFLTYLKKVETALVAGNATEHTHRPALKELLESFKPKITATNEPKREECGAPDYVVSEQHGHGPLTIGYVETTDVGLSLDAMHSLIDSRKQTNTHHCFSMLPNPTTRSANV